MARNCSKSEQRYVVTTRQSGSGEKAFISAYLVLSFQLLLLKNEVGGKKLAAVIIPRNSFFAFGAQGGRDARDRYSPAVFLAELNRQH